MEKRPIALRPDSRYDVHAFGVLLRGLWGYRGAKAEKLFEPEP